MARRKRRDVMLAIPYDEARLIDWLQQDGEVVLQTKLNGVRCRCLIQEDSVQMLSSAALPITSMPHVAMELHNLCEYAPLELDGELYTHGISLQEVSGMARRHEPDPRHADVQYHVFDIVCPGQSNKDRAMAVLGIVKMAQSSDMSPIRDVDTQLADNTYAVQAYLAHVMEHGYEGVILRKASGVYERRRSTHLMKIKPRCIDSYPIIGVQEETTTRKEDSSTGEVTDPGGRTKGALGAFICAADGGTFRVGTGPVFTRAGRERLWSDRTLWQDKKVVVKYQELTEKGIPFCPVAVKIVG